MKEDEYQNEIKAVKLLQDRTDKIDRTHSSIRNEIDEIKAELASLGASELLESPDFLEKKNEHLGAMSRPSSLPQVRLHDIYQESALRYPERLHVNDILTPDDWQSVDDKLERRISDFNARYSLDAWDYAIAGSCGLFASMLDLLCIKAPPEPSSPWQQEVDGVFNKWVQEAFNKVLPPGISDLLSKGNSIGAPDSSVMTALVGAPAKLLNPINHRFRSLAHDPILGFLFGAWDMMNGTCTVITNGKIHSFPSTKGSVDGNIFQLLGRMFGHLLSDVNAPSANGNRGMGLPAPLVGVLRMFEGIPVGNSTFEKQIEWMYVNGYDFRQFAVTSVPMAIMEVLLRAFFVIKQMKVYNAPFGESMLDTMPIKMNPRFRIMLALSYGTSSAVNVGKIHVTQNILNANYASWIGLAWNGFHALKWTLIDSQLNLWNEIETKEIAEIKELIGDIDRLSERASRLPG